MNPQIKVFLDRWFVQPLLRAYAAVAVPPRMWRDRLRWPLQYFRGLPFAIRTLLVAAFAFVVCAALTALILFTIAFHYIYFNRSDLPAIEQFAGFKFSTIGHVY